MQELHSRLKSLKLPKLLKSYRSLLSLLLATIALLAVLSSPVKALQAQLQPTSPHLGDTLSVVVRSTSDGSPTIVMNQKEYGTFDIGNGRYRALLPTTPLDRPGQIEVKVSAGSDSQTLTTQLRDRTFPTQSIWLSGGGDDLGTDHEFDRVDAFKTLVSSEKYWSGAFKRPANGEVTSIYGVQRYYNGEFAEDYYHRGVDYGGGIGDAVMAPAAGKVVLVGRVADGFELHGNTIGIDHGQGVLSIFIHLSRIDVKEGDVVKAGQTIGGIGDTGAATGPHLHWGLYVNGQSVDPVPWRETGFE